MTEQICLTTHGCSNRKYDRMYLHIYTYTCISIYIVCLAFAVSSSNCPKINKIYRLVMCLQSTFITCHCSMYVDATVAVASECLGQRAKRIAGSRGLCLCLCGFRSATHDAVATTATATTGAAARPVKFWPWSSVAQWVVHGWTYKPYMI